MSTLNLPSESNDEVLRETVTFQFGNDDQLNPDELTQTISSAVQTILGSLNTNRSNNTTSNTTSNTVTTNNVSLEEFDCSICKELLCEPIILMCQHSFCFACIQKHNNKDKRSEPDSLNPVNPQLRYNMHDHLSLNQSSLCPLCKFPFIIPPKYNNEFENLLSFQFPEEYKERKENLKINQQRDEMEEKMRKEVWNIINKNPPVEDKYWNLNQQLQPIPRLNYRNVDFVCAGDEIEPQQGFFGKTFSLMSSIAKSPIFQGTVMMSVAIPFALYISKKMNVV